MRFISLVLAFICACDVPTQSSPSRADAEHPVRVDPPPSSPSYNEVVETLATQRGQLAKRLARVGASEKDAIIGEARELFSRTLIENLLPRWMGTPWAMNGTTNQPGEGEIACGYFVSTILRDAGFNIHRTRFGQAAALRIQQATTPPGRKVHTFFSIAPELLAKKIAALGDGVYIIGLNVHVGFVVVRDGDVRLVHASYTDERVVVDEPLASARAIELSRPKGYFVSELVSTDAAVVRWIEQQPLRLP